MFHDLMCFKYIKMFHFLLKTEKVCMCMLTSVSFDWVFNLLALLFEWK